MVEQPKQIIIYAEDRDTHRMAWEDIFSSAGYEVRAFPDGKAALSAIKQSLAAGEAPLLVTDLQMPDMNGIDLLKALAAENIKLPRVMLTGDMDASEQLQRADVNVDALLLKSSSLRPALEAIKRAVEKHQLAPKSPMDQALRPTGGSDLPAL